MLAAANLALAEPAIVATTFTVTRAIRLADPHADARHIDSDALGTGRRRSIKRRRGSKAQQDE
jgi:hypothetical protein